MSSILKIKCGGGGGGGVVEWFLLNFDTVDNFDFLGFMLIISFLLFVLKQYQWWSSRSHQHHDVIAHLQPCPCLELKYKIKWFHFDWG